MGQGLEWLGGQAAASTGYSTEGIFQGGTPEQARSATPMTGTHQGIDPMVGGANPLGNFVADTTGPAIDPLGPAAFPEGP